MPPNQNRAKPVYSIHDPRGPAILTQLRVGLSMLNLHKFRHNFRDTLNPMCPSNDGVEDTEHFLLHCHSYDGYRTDLLDSVNSTLQPYDLPNLSNALMLKLILYGDERLSVDSNSEIFKATLRYIYAESRKSHGSTAVSRRKVVLFTVIFEEGLLNSIKNPV